MKIKEVAKRRAERSHTVVIIKTYLQHRAREDKYELLMLLIVNAFNLRVHQT